MGQMLVVTGAAGQKSGGAFAEQMAEHIAQVRAMFPDGIRLLLRPGTDSGRLSSLLPAAELRFGDLSDPSFMDSSLEGADTVVHIAGIQLSETLIDSAVRCGVRRLILVHTTGIYSKYKQAGETYRKIDAYVTNTCHDAGILLTLLRPTMVYGNPTDRNVIKFIQMVDRLPVMPVVRGARYTLQPVFYRDLAKAYLDVLFKEDTTKNKAYVLSGAQPILLRDMLLCIGEKLGKGKVRFLSVPYWFAYSGAVCLYGISLGKVDYREKVQRLCESRAYPHDDAARDFGFAPQDFRAGVEEEIQQYLRNKFNQ